MSRPAKTVAIQPCTGDYRAVLPRLLSLAEADDIVRPGDSVLIKPNLHAPQDWTTGGTTPPALVAALIEWARSKGASRILVADSPFMGNPRPEETFTLTGMAQAVEEAGAEWTVLTRHGYKLFRGVSPHLPAELGISRLVFEFDKLINVAIMKTHIDCLVTLGMKNLKGCIRNEDKAAFHQTADINRALVALNRILRPHLTLVDGTVGMEGIGPHAGTPPHFGHIFASLDTPAVDLVAASAMGVELDEARTLKYAREEGMLTPDAIRAVGEDVADIRRRFERPYEAMMRELPGLRLQADGACSACKLHAIRALRENAQAGTPVPEALVVIGNQPSDEAEALRLGRCAREACPEGRCLPGCPPSVEKAREFLAGSSKGG